MSHVAPLPRLTAETDQLTIQSWGIFHLPSPLILSKSSDGTTCLAWKTPLSTFVSQSAVGTHYELVDHCYLLWERISHGIPTSQNPDLQHHRSMHTSLASAESRQNT